MRFSSAVSEHPVTSHAVGEVAGQVLESLGERPDLVLVFVTPPHGGALEDAAGAVEAILEPGALLGCVSESVASTGREIENSAAVCVWAGCVGPVTTFSLDEPEWSDLSRFDPSAIVLLGDPFTFNVEAFFAWLSEVHPGLAVIGGMASGARGPGGTRLVVDGRIRTAGAVGALLGPGVELSTVVSQGCRPIGYPMAATRSEGNIIYELAGQPALERLLSLARDELSDQEIAVINSGGLQLGRVIDERKPEFERGDFLVRNVIGADRDNGAIAVADVIDLGSTVQFHLRDAATADEDLRSLLGGRRAEAALLFTCNGRGTRLFGRPHHDAKVLAEAVGEVPTAGFFAAGEFGPVGGRNFLHGFTASVALFGG